LTSPQRQQGLRSGYGGPERKRSAVTISGESRRSEELTRFPFQALQQRQVQYITLIIMILIIVSAAWKVQGNAGFS
jgi:hypothetical protein